jgi:hypothetical protein
MDYTVKPGDSLSAIAGRYGVSLQTIMTLNPAIRDPNQIRVGQVIHLPDPLSSTAGSGGEAGATSSGAGSPTPESASSGSLQFNRSRFFAGYRSHFGNLSQGQVDGLEQLLGAFEADPTVTDIQVVAYMLATVKHETADKFQPISEYGSRSYFNKYDPVLAATEKLRKRAREMGNTAEGDGYAYRGRGYVQITWKNNYKKLGEVLGYDLVSEPDLALKPEVAYKIMSYGMRNGTFTGAKISKFIGEGSADYYEARVVINDHDKATDIKGYAEKFEQILRDSTA